jgi:hypothetical protein
MRAPLSGCCHPFSHFRGYRPGAPGLNPRLMAGNLSGCRPLRCENKELKGGHSAMSHKLKVPCARQTIPA